MKSIYWGIFLLWGIAIVTAQDYKKEFETLWKTGDYEKQGEALYILGKSNDQKYAKILIDQLKIVEKMQLVQEQKIAKKGNEVDKLEDGDSEKIPIQIEMIKLRDELAQYDFIVDKAGQGIALFTDPKAIKFLAGEALKMKSVSAKLAMMSALGKLDNEDALEILMKALKDRAPQIRQIAVESLKAKTPKPAFEAVLALVGDKTWQVQSAVMETLAKYDDPRAIKPLIDQLKNEKGRVVEDIEKALNALTGESHEGNGHVWQARYTVEQEKWMQGIKKQKEKVEAIPTIDNPLRGTRKYYQDVESRRNPSKGKGNEGTTVTFVPAGERIIYLLDFSGSMNDPAPQNLIKAESVIVGESKQMSKIELLRKKFEKELPKLQPHQSFTVIFYNHKIQWWKKELVPGTPDNINKALTVVRATPAEGSTNTYGAIEQAFNMAGRGNFDKSYETSFDTVVLVTDGMPTGEYQIQQKTAQKPNLQRDSVIKFLDAVLKLNQLRRIKINVIGIPPDPMDDVLGGLAADSGGTYQYWELK